MSNQTGVIWEGKNEDVIRDIIKLRDKHGIGELRAVELFSSDGHTISADISRECVSFVGYDIVPEKEEAFKKNVVNGEFRCKDSMKMIMTMKEGEVGTFNLISTDAPCCIYGENYCEHFQTLEYIYKLFEEGDKILCIFPVILKPYDTDKEENRAWMKEREVFYRTKETNLNPEKTFTIYDELFDKQNLRILERSCTCRELRNGIDWLYQFMYVLEKK